MHDKRAKWCWNGMLPFDIWINDDLYKIPIGLIEFSPTNAPFLNLIKLVPFVVPPSGYTISGGNNPFSHCFYLSDIFSNINFLESLSDLSIKRQLQASANWPTPGTFLTMAFETWLGGYLYACTEISTQLEWFEIIHPGLSYDGFQSGPKYFL